jgi:hypothetical protein
MRSRLLFSCAALCGLLLSPVPVRAETPPQKPQMQCNIGPVIKTYGGTKWIVFSCNDDRTVVIATAPKNPAMPFYFTLYPKDDGYGIYGDGTGKKDVTDAALKDIKALSGKDIVALVQETKTQKQQ